MNYPSVYLADFFFKRTSAFFYTPVRFSLRFDVLSLRKENGNKRI